MFEFVSGQPQPMLSYLEQYLDDWHWCHATDVVPMIAMAPPEGWPLWDAEALRDEGMRRHLIRGLDRWKAFRTYRALPYDPREVLLRELPAFIADIQAIPDARLCLSDVPEDGIRAFASTLTARLRRLGPVVKQTDSCVLPSKAAHFLLLGLVPAYDQQVIQNDVIWWLAPRANNMESYLLLCWWVLQQFQEEGTLDEARPAVAEYMLSRPMAWTRRLPRPGADHWLLNSMDSVVAEYTLIQMARNVEQRYLLRWAASVTTGQ
jgi:hypothetical protein